MVRERVIQQAGKLFSVHGIKKVSMDEVASSLGISKRTIYTVFADKEDVVRSCVDSFQEKRERRVLEIKKNAANIVQACLQIIDGYRNTPLPNYLLWEDIEKYYPNIHQQIQEGAESSKNYTKQLLEEGIWEGYFRQDLNVDAAVVLFDIDTFIKVGSIYAEKTTPTGANPIFMIMVNLMRGISTPEGVEAIDQYRASLPAASLFKNIGNHPLTRSVSAS